MTAVYRLTKDNWTADRAYEEMRRFHFEGFPGHPELKAFVYAYARQIEAVPEIEAVPASTGSASTASAATAAPSTASTLATR
jgi:hypothetical protein